MNLNLFADFKAPDGTNISGLPLNTGQNWSVNGSPFVVEGNKARMNLVSGQGAFAIADAGPGNTDQEASATVFVPFSGVSGGIGVLGRFTLSPGGTGYLAWLSIDPVNPATNSKLNLSYNNSGGFAKLASLVVPLQLGAWYKISLVTKGPLIKAVLADTFEISITDIRNQGITDFGIYADTNDGDMFASFACSDAA